MCFKTNDIILYYIGNGIAKNTKTLKKPTNSVSPSSAEDNPQRQDPFQANSSAPHSATQLEPRTMKLFTSCVNAGFVSLNAYD